ncbi:MAG TPA: DUF354 domain-containing protein [Edaphobacter sp.]
MSELALNPAIEQVKADPRLSEEAVKDGRRGEVWIDLDNSPHVPLFAPIIEELERSGHPTLVTARDCFQVCGLADLLDLKYKRIGHHYGKHKVMKLAGLGLRSLQLLPSVLRNRPVLAISHGSRSQLLVANLLRIPCITIADYEFAKLWMFMKPTWVMTPEVIQDNAIQISKERILKYPGIKEDVYVPKFKPDPRIVDDLCLADAEIVVLLRPPATEAHYHRPESDELFQGVLDFLGTKSHAKVVILPRNDRQEADIRSKWPSLFATGQVVIPDKVVDGLNLIWHCDLMISGGGTMNREAAALGVPVYSIFRGKIGAVDKYLASVGRMTLIEDKESISRKIILEKRARVLVNSDHPNMTLNAIVRHITRILKQAPKKNGRSAYNSVQ